MALKEHYQNMNELKADVLHEMREVLNTRGWVQGTLEDDEGSVCFMGAYNTIFFDNSNPFLRGHKSALKTLPIQRKYAYESLLKELKVHLRKMYGKEYAEPTESWPIERWNDQKERTFEEVEKAIMQMADYYETRYLEGFQS